MHIKAITLASILFALLVAGVARSSGLDGSPEITTPPKNSLVVAKTRGGSSGQVETFTESNLESHPMAKNSDAHQFREAMDRNELEAAKEIFEKSSDGLREYYGRWFVQRERDKVVSEISSFDQSTIKEWMLQMVFIHGDQEFIGYIIRRIGPSNELLMRVALCVDLAACPDRFISLLKRMTNKFWQKGAVGYGVCALFNSAKTESFDPLLRELSDKFSDSTLADAAIVQAFVSGCMYCRHPEQSLFAIKYYNYHALSADHYASGLANAYQGNGSNPGFFEFLLLNAKPEDLEMVMGKSSFGTEPSEYQEAVRRTLAHVSPQTKMTSKRREAIKGILEAGIPLAIIKIIWDYDI